MLHEMTIASLTIDPDSHTPIIVLKSDDEDKTLMIWIGVLEATSIIYALQGISFERPLTHDLFKNFLERMAFKITRIEINDLDNNTFYAKIYFTTGEKEFYMDARPSDAIAMAIRFNTSIYVDHEVIEKAKQGSEKVEVADDSEEGKKWAEYLENLSQEDFGKYKV